MPAEEVAEFERRRLRRVRAVRGVVVDRGAEVLAQRAGVGLGRVGRAHEVAPLLDGVRRLEAQHDARARRHEVGQPAEERAAPGGRRRSPRPRPCDMWIMRAARTVNPAASMRARICPIDPLLTASGLMMANVRCISDRLYLARDRRSAAPVAGNSRADNTRAPAGTGWRRPGRPGPPACAARRGAPRRPRRTRTPRPCPAAAATRAW